MRTHETDQPQQSDRLARRTSYRADALTLPLVRAVAVNRPKAVPRGCLDPTLAPAVAVNRPKVVPCGCPDLTRKQWLCPLAVFAPVYPTRRFSLTVTLGHMMR